MPPSQPRGENEPHANFSIFPLIEFEFGAPFDKSEETAEM
jgi:hypothetical protein